MAREQFHPRGWANYETWWAAVWIGTDDDTHGECLDRARQSTAALRDYFTDRQLGLLFDEGASFARDAIKEALGKVDWREVQVALLNGLGTKGPWAR